MTRKFDLRVRRLNPEAGRLKPRVRGSNRQAERLNPRAGRSSREAAQLKRQATQSKCEAGQLKRQARQSKCEAGQFKRQAMQSSRGAGQLIWQAMQSKREAAQLKRQAGQSKCEAGQLKPRARELSSRARESPFGRGELISWPGKKSNFSGIAREGTRACITTRLHSARTTQLWDAEVTNVPQGLPHCGVRESQRENDCVVSVYAVDSAPGIIENRRDLLTALRPSKPAGKADWFYLMFRHVRYMESLYRRIVVLCYTLFNYARH
jgi:hypothetical protein